MSARPRRRARARVQQHVAAPAFSSRQLAGGRLSGAPRGLAKLFRRNADWLERAEDAAVQVLQAMTELAERRSSVIAEVLPVDETPQLWRHYPQDDVHDAVTGAQFYYHCHDARETPAGEHGHFHLFMDPLRAASNDPGLARDPARLVHLVAIAISENGLPQRLFTTNRWVTGDRWVSAAEATEMLRGYAFAGEQAQSPLQRWLGGMAILFYPQAIELLRLRDERLRRLTAGGKRPNVLEDRRMHVVSQCPIDIQSQVAALETALVA